MAFPSNALRLFSIIRGRDLIAGAAFLAGIFLVAWLMLGMIKQQIQNDLRNNMHTIVRTTQDAVQFWIEEQFETLELIRQNPEVIAAVETVLSSYAAQEQLVNHPALKTLVSQFSPWIEKHGGQGFSLLPLDDYSITPLPDEKIVIIRPFASSEAVIEQALQRKSQLQLPCRLQTTLPDGHGALERCGLSMIFYVPVIDARDTVIGVLAVHVDPVRDFSRILQLTHSGKTGEGYLFNAEGEAITSLRFNEQVREFGLIDAADSSALLLRLADPGGDLSAGYDPRQHRTDMPLTRMAESAVEGEPGIDLDGYRDYRGASVIGIWDWNDDFQFGMAYEMEFTEAYGTYRAIRHIVHLSLTALVVLFFLTFFMFRQRQAEVIEHNRICTENEEKFRTVTDAVTDAIIMIDHENLIRFWSQSSEKMFGYTKEEADGKSLHDLIVPEPYRRKALGKWPEFQQTGGGALVGNLREFQAIGPDGKLFPAEVLINPLRVNNQWWAVGTVRDIGQRKKAEQLLMASERRLKEAHKMAKLGHWEKNLDTGTMSWSEELYHIFGWELSAIEPNYQEFLDRVHPEDRDYVDGFYKNTAQPKSNYEVVHRLLLEKGRIKYVTARGQTEFDEKGVPIGLRGTMQDITERIEHENELRQLSERLELAAHAARFGIFDWNLVSDELYWDEILYDIFGVQAAANLRGQDIMAKRIHPDDMERIQTEVGDALSGEKEFDTYFRIRLAEDETRYVKANAKVYRDLSGTPMRMVGLNYDITTTIEAQEKLRHLNDELEARVEARTEELERSKKAALSIMQDAHRSKTRAEETLTQLREAQAVQHKLSRAVEASPASVVVTDATGTIEYVNPKFVETTGYTAAEALGLSPRILKSGQHSTEFYQEMWATIATGETWRGEVCNRKKDGSLYWELALISPVCNEEGEIINYVAVKEDVTEKRKADEELKRALARAEEATQAKSDFLANMSHEIRTPMNAVIGMSHLALQTDLTRQQKDYLSNISVASKTLLSIINDILDFSKIEAGKMSIERTPFNLTEVVNDAVALTSPQMADKDIELLINLDDDIPPVLIGDPVRTTQVFKNLLSNAAKFTERGEIEVTATVKKRKKRHLVLRCSVMDSGIGMTEEQMKKLFQKFSQADSSTTRKYGGTGLGLAICSQLVGLMGGEIYVNSVPDQGSTFTFTLHLGYQADRRHEKAYLLPDNLRHLKVLLIEKRSKIRNAVEKQLQALSFRADSCMDGREAVAALTEANRGESPYGFVVLDHRLNDSGEDGLQVLNRIRQETALHQLPALIMTTNRDRPAVSARAQKLEMCAVMAKPVNLPGLYNAIVDLFGHDELQLQSRRDFSIDNEHNRSLLEGVNVLLAEDNPINQQVAQELLVSANVTVTIVDDGIQAVQAVKDQRFDLVLMDIQMPEMDGLAATRAIRDWEQQRLKDEADVAPLPIIAMTAHAMAGDREKSLNAGMNDHITKPIDPKALYACLIRWIRYGHSPQQPTGMENDMPVERDAEAVTKEEVLPARIEGVDVEDGLRRVAGNQRLFRQLLYDFQNDYRDVPGQLQESSAGKDDAFVKRTIHTLKGIAGNLGMTDLHQCALNVEIALSEGNRIDESLAVFCDSLKHVLKGLEKALPRTADDETEPAPDKVAVDRDALRPQVESLRQLLELNDMEAIAVFSQLSQPLSMVDAKNTEKIASALNGFDFRGARTSVDALLQTLEQTDNVGME